jgi:hypothetical protein
MKINTAVCLLSLVLLPACSTTRTTVGNPSMEQRKIAKYASTESAEEPAPPAEGPDDIPANVATDVRRNPGLVPTPVLRQSAASDTP